MIDENSLVAQAARADTRTERERLLRLWRIEKRQGLIRACELCPLHVTRKNAVPFHAENWDNIDLLLVGEAPGKLEDEQGVPFVGRSGELLDKLLDEAGSSRERVAILNTVACRPPKNRDPSREERSACKPHFEDQIRVANVPVGIAFGAYAVLALTGRMKPIGQLRGKRFEAYDMTWFAAWHPAYVLRNPRAREGLLSDIQRAVEYADQMRLRNNLPVPEKREPRDHKLIIRDIWDLLNTQGWVHIYAHRISEEFILIRGLEVEVPEKYGPLPVWTIDEFTEMDKKAQKLMRNPPVSEFLAAQELKKNLGGTVADLLYGQETARIVE